MHDHPGQLHQAQARYRASGNRRKKVAGSTPESGAVTAAPVMEPASVADKAPATELPFSSPAPTPTATKFVVGATVRGLNGSPYGITKEGWIGKITSTEESSPFIYVEGPGILRSTVVNKRYFEVIDATVAAPAVAVVDDTEIRKGDKVIGLADASYEYTVTKQGWIGTVTSVDGDTIWVEGTNKNGDYVHYAVTKRFFKKYIEPVAVPATGKLIDKVKVGDIVRCKAFNCCGKRSNIDGELFIDTGWRGKVMQLDKGDDWDLEVEGLDAHGCKGEWWVTSDNFELI